MRGVPEDYDNWASWGNDEWSFVNTLPYFRKAETDTDIVDDFHGNDGPIPVRRHKQETWLPAQNAFYRSARDAGYPHDPDMNHPESWGIGPIPMNNPNGVRMSTSLTYLNPVRNRLNLTVRGNVTVHKVVIEDGRATGVDVESGGERFVVDTEQVILSAGGIGSPQLLMLSGVGPADHLRETGIPVLLDLPGVGQNLRDHPNVRVPIRVKDDFPLDPEAPRSQLALRYTATGSSDRNDMQIMQSSFSSPNRRRSPGREKASVSPLSWSLADGAGELKLASADPHDQPALNYRYLEESRDRERLREGVRICLGLLEHDAYKDIVEEAISPTPDDLASDEALDQWMRLNVTTTQHISGTCKMGPDSDPMAVLGPILPG